MYKFKQPELHEIVFVQVSEKNKDQNYVQLIDYDNIDGLVLCTEITRYNSNIKKVVKRNEIFPVVIISTEKGYDLSYSKIKNDSRILLKDCYDYQNKIYNLINKISDILKLDKNIHEEIIKNNLDPSIYDECINSNKNLPKELYESILINSDILFENIEKFENKENFKNIESVIKNFNTEIQNMIIKKPYIIQKDFKLLIFDENSLEILKEIINKIQNIDIEDKKLMNYIVECKSSPIYYYQLSNTDINLINCFVKNIDEKITQIAEYYNCNFKLNENYDIIKSGEILFS